MFLKSLSVCIKRTISFSERTLNLKESTRFGRIDKGNVSEQNNIESPK
jgi:hypothetical protein